MIEDRITSLNELMEFIRHIRSYMGISRKKPLKELYGVLFPIADPKILPNYGDDAAAIRWQDGYLLLSADGIMKGLLTNEPYAAGKASVMVTVNDIYSMGGRPIALVNVLASGDEEQRLKILEGIKKGCEKLKVPMVGGHLHPDVGKDEPELSVAILGYARKLLHGWKARPGDNIIVAVDLNGEVGCKTVTSWDSNSHKTSEELLDRLEALPIIAENELANACKDISNAGLLGTICIMAENSATGAIVYLDEIPHPVSINMKEWVKCFQSYGFVLSVNPLRVGEVIQIFEDRKISARVVGKIIEENKVWLCKDHFRGVLFDFERDHITGIKAKDV